MASMCGIFTYIYHIKGIFTYMYIWLIFMVNAGKYSKDGWYGYDISFFAQNASSTHSVQQLADDMKEELPEVDVDAADMVVSIAAESIFQVT